MKDYNLILLIINLLILVRSPIPNWSLSAQSVEVMTSTSTGS